MTQSTVIPEIYRPKTAAQIIGVSKSHLHNMIKAGTIKAVRITPACVGIPKAELDSFIASLQAV